MSRSGGRPRPRGSRPRGPRSRGMQGCRAPAGASKGVAGRQPARASGSSLPYPALRQCQQPAKDPPCDGTPAGSAPRASRHGAPRWRRITRARLRRRTRRGRRRRPGAPSGPAGGCPRRAAAAARGEAPPGIVPAAESLRPVRTCGRCAGQPGGAGGRQPPAERHRPVAVPSRCAAGLGAPIWPRPRCTSASPSFPRQTRGFEQATGPGRTTVAPSHAAARHPQGDHR